MSVISVYPNKTRLVIDTGRRLIRRVFSISRALKSSLSITQPSVQTHPHKNQAYLVMCDCNARKFRTFYSLMLGLDYECNIFTHTEPQFFLALQHRLEQHLMSIYVERIVLYFQADNIDQNKAIRSIITYLMSHTQHQNVSVVIDCPLFRFSNEQMYRLSCGGRERKTVLSVATRHLSTLGCIFVFYLEGVTPQKHFTEVLVKLLHRHRLRLSWYIVMYQLQVVFSAYNPVLLTSRPVNIHQHYCLVNE